MEGGLLPVSIVIFIAGENLGLCCDDDHHRDDYGSCLAGEFCYLRSWSLLW